MGIFHVDQPNRDSLVCDLMEPVRPQVGSGGRVFAGLDHHAASQEGMVFRAAQRECEVDGITYGDTCQNGSDLGASRRAGCRVGCASLVEFCRDVSKQAANHVHPPYTAAQK
jgi:hypothetical protein